MIRQLPFDLPVRPAMGRGDFFVSPSNTLAVAALDGWRQWPQGKMLLLGPPGAGKTHLAHVWAADAAAVLVDAQALGSADLPALAAHGAVAVEDAATLAGDAAGQTAFFHLHNLMAARGAPLLVTASAPVRDWGVTLPDLVSRLQAAPATRLDPPDDALLAALLVKLFADRQIAVAPALIPYLVARMDRSFAAASDLVARLDRAALAQGRPVSRHLARTLLDTPAAAG